MSRAARIALVTIALGLVGLATTLATIAGAIDAVDWAFRTFGTVPVYLVGAFFAGAVITHGIHRGMAASGGSGSNGGREPDGLPPRP